MTEAPECRCGLRMSKNPHPDSGKPFTLCEIGAVWVCIPCSQRTLHLWCERALAAEKRLGQIATIAQASKDDQAKTETTT